MDALQDKVMALEIALAQVPVKDQSFAKSLIASYAKYKSLSPKQVPWVETLLSRAMGTAQPPAPTSSVGDFSGVYALFAKAREFIKFPKIKLMAPGVGLIVLAISGKNSKTPNVVNVTDGKPYGSSVWFGRVSASGEWAKPRSEPVNVQAVEELLKKLAADPVKVASEYGKLTGSCCFCSLPLSDPQSVAAGFGKKCAQNFGLFAAYKEAEQINLTESLA